MQSLITEYLIAHQYLAKAIEGESDERKLCDSPGTANSNRDGSCCDRSALEPVHQCDTTGNTNEGSRLATSTWCTKG